MRRYLSSRCDASTDRLRPTSYLIAIQNIGRLKSFVDDLDMEWGIVRMRVGLSYDLLRFSLLFRDLSGFRAFDLCRLDVESAPPPTNTTKTPIVNNPLVRVCAPGFYPQLTPPAPHLVLRNSVTETYTTSNRRVVQFVHTLARTL